MPFRVTAAAGRIVFYHDHCVGDGYDPHHCLIAEETRSCTAAMGRGLHRDDSCEAVVCGHDRRGLAVSSQYLRSIFQVYVGICRYV